MDNKAGRTFGAMVKTKRIATGKTLRQFCQEHGLDPGNMSKLERGLLPAPSAREKLEEYAKYLGLKKGSDEWFEFFDLAAAEAGRIPEDLTDEAVLRRLPVLFRTLRDEKVSEEQLDRLIDRMKPEVPLRTVSVSHIGAGAMKTRLNIDEAALRGFCTRHGIRRLALFGSVLKGTDRPDSDVDLLVEFDPGLEPGLIGLSAMEQELSGLMGGRRIDLRTTADLSRHFRDDVIRTAEVRYARP
jgi:hypothetical protein